MDRRQRTRPGTYSQPRVNPNRRAFPRWPAEFEARIISGSHTYSVEPIEIGECGLSMRIGSDLPFQPEFDLEFRLLAPASDWVRVKVTLKHVDAERCGVEFLNLRREDRLRIVDYIYSGLQRGPSA
jgi:hypothetical protein